MSNTKKSVMWVALGVVVVAALVLFGGPLLWPTDPDDEAMKVRRPTPAARRAPGQISVDSSTDPNAPVDTETDEP